MTKPEKAGGASRSPAAQTASRRNGARSCGPRTRKGKRRSARNALKHGLRARRVLDPALLPPWLVEIENDVIMMLPDVDVRRREFLDAMLLSCLQITEVDAMIDAVSAQQFALRDDAIGSAGGSVPGVPAPEFLLRERPGGLADLARLMSYRRRFRGRRDRCIARLFPERWGEKPDAAMEQLYAAQQLAELGPPAAI